MTVWTSDNNPIRVSWLESPALSDWHGGNGRLGMTFLPGKKAQGIYGQHARTLALDIEALKESWGVDDFVLLVEDHELERFQVPELPAIMAEAGIRLIRLPIRDGGVPSDPNAVRQVILQLRSALAEGRDVVIACRGGLGRTGTIAACALVTAGMSPDDAIAAVRSARHGTVENHEQEAFVREYASIGSADPES